MKVRVNAKLTEVTEWSRDEWRIAGDASHEGDSAVLSLVAEEVKEKLEDCTFKPKGLPFECEFVLDVDRQFGVREEDVKDRLLDEYISQFAESDYVVPTDCEFEYEVSEE